MPLPLPPYRRADLGLAHTETVKQTVFNLFNTLQGVPKRTDRVVSVAAAFLLFCHKLNLSPAPVLEAAYQLLFDSERLPRPEWQAVHLVAQNLGDH